jgi:DNA methyltransferase 1-associated protein 1
VSIVDTAKAYRRGFKRDFKPARWENVEFDNSARSDGLRLKHWRKQPTQPTQPTQPVQPVAASGDAMEVDPEQPPTAMPPPEYEFAKYDVEVTVPTFTDAQYERYLRDADWTRDETDYLMSLVKAYAQKWPVIIDRYEWSPVQSESQGLELSKSSPRDLESLKARYYSVCAKAMEFSLPNGVADMNAEEFALHEQYGKFNPETERTRKGLAWQLCRRSADDVKEEEYLLSELQRIMISAQKYENERAELRQRLEHVDGANQHPLQLTSAQLNHLYTQLMMQDRNRKSRGGRMSIDTLQSPATGGGLATPASATAHRDSLGGSGQKKASASALVPARQLSPRDEARFGVTTHDRLTSGVTFRTDKILKLRAAKSHVQTQKIIGALTNLEIPELLPLPTTRVVEHFEALIGRINVLLDLRKVLAKEEAELQTARQIRDALERQKAEEAGPAAGGHVGAVKAEGEGEVDAEGEDVDMATPGQAEGEAVGEDDGDDESLDDDDDDDDDMDAEETRPSSSRSNQTAGYKRSASVLSTASSKASRRKK